MSKVIFCRGIQGSGKSTWAKEWVNKDPIHRIRINWDDIRNMMGPYWVPEREHVVIDCSVDILRYALGNDYDVVIDNMNLSKKSTEIFHEVCRDMEVSSLYKDFKTPLEVCIERDSKRKNPIGESVIRNTYNKYKDFYNNEDN